MPIPIIETTQNVVGANQYEPFIYKPYASNDPADWFCNNLPLPPGVTLDPDSGEIHGPCTMQGTYNIGLVAHNASGNSLPLVVSIGIDPAPSPLTGAGLELTFETQSKEVKLVDGGDFKIYAAFGDDIVAWTRVLKKVAVLDLDVTDIKLVIREYDQGNDLVISTDWTKRGTGTSAIYGVHAKAAGDELKAVVGDYEADSGTMLEGWAELQFTYNNPDVADFGPETLTLSTKRFPIQIGSEYVANAE